jgi:uncharacterized damage-inducible protein DinB
MDISRHFLNRSAYYLRDYYWPRLREAVDLLTENDVWLREGDASNSIGNLLLHMAGNVRQHIIAGVGQRHDDHRDRTAEFAAVGGMTKKELLDRLGMAVMEAADVLETLDPSQLMTMREIQDKDEVLFDDIYHVVEHFGYHTGQIIYVVKAMKQHRFGWYKYLDKVP